MSWRSLSLVLVFGLMGCPPGNPEDSDTDTDTGSDTDSGTDADTDSGTDAAAINCHILPTTLPEWAGDIDNASVTATSYANDAGVAAVKTAAAGVGSDPVTVDLTVTGANVTAVGYSPNDGTASTFWIADANDAIQVRLDFESEVTVSVGDTVSFTATEVDAYGGEPQISALTGYSVDSSGNPVLVLDNDGSGFDYASDGGFVHRLHGEMVGAAEVCGNNYECFGFEIRTDPEDASTTSAVRFRIGNGNLTTPLTTGDCIEIVGPLSIFSGDLQFDINNFGWHRWYGNVND